MTPLDRVRIEKAGADCGFEMTPLERDGGLEMRSAHFPESVLVQVTGATGFTVTAAGLALASVQSGAGSVLVEGFSALYDVLRTAAARARAKHSHIADIFHRKTKNLPQSTEAERIVVQRVGQNLFRAALLDYWQGRCCVTGLDIPALLRASHIKPWAACSSDHERLDVFNGLLLAPQLDALFDGGWMTVATDGTVGLSSQLPPESRVRLGLPEVMVVKQLSSQHQAYLDFHRRKVFKD